MKKRFLAIFMSLCMMLGAVPLTAFAGEGGSEEAVCSCEEACTEENVNEDCGVCVGDYIECEAEKPLACICEEACTEESINKDCPLCIEDYAKCIVQNNEPIEDNKKDDDSEDDVIYKEKEDDLKEYKADETDSLSLYNFDAPGTSVDNPIEVPASGLAFNNGVVYGISQEWYKEKKKEITGSEDVEENRDFKLYVSVVIPSEIDGKAVKTIGFNSFTNSFANEKYDNGAMYVQTDDTKKSYLDIGTFSVVSVDMESADNLETIETQAFYNCTDLEGIIIFPDSLKNFGESFVFGNCTKLEGVVWSDNLEYLGDFDDGDPSGAVFYGCSNLRFATTKEKYEEAEQNGDLDTFTDLTFPDGLKFIGSQCFQNAFQPGLGLAVTIPASVETIGSQAFYNSDVKEIRYSQFVVERTADEDLTGYDYAAFKWRNDAAPDKVCLIIMADKANYDYFLNDNNGLSYVENAVTYPMDVQFKNGDDIVETEHKLYKQYIQYEMDPDTGVWSRNTDYELPEIPGGIEPEPGYKGSVWIMDGKELTVNSKVTSDTVTLRAGGELEEPQVIFNIKAYHKNGELQTATMKSGQVLTLPINEYQRIEIVPQITHPLAGSSKDDIFFWYKWNDSDDTRDGESAFKYGKQINTLKIDDISDARSGSSYYQLDIDGKKVGSSWGPSYSADTSVYTSSDKQYYIKIKLTQSAENLAYITASEYQYFADNVPEYMLSTVYDTAEELISEYLYKTFGEETYIESETLEGDYLSVDWALKAESIYSSEPGEYNTFVWTASQEEFADLGWTNTNNIPLTGEVTIQNPYSVTFIADGNTADVKYLTKSGTLAAADFPAVPVKSGYTGVWSVTEDIVNPVSNIIVTANYTPVTYSISYELDGGENDSANPVSYTVENDIVLKNPTKSGYSFTGWTYENQDEPKKDLTLPAGSVTGDLHFTAHWDKKSDGGSSSGGSSYSLSSEAYYVRYHDGDDLVKDGKYGEGERVTVKGDVFEAPLGKALAGWSTEEDGKVEYVPGDTFRMPDKSVNLYAVWEDETQIHNAYISGYPDGTVRPDKTITRAEAAVMFYNLLDEKNGYINTFTDVPENQWYSEAVITLAGMGVVNGYLDGTFRPDAPITRAEFVTMAVNFAKAGNGTYCSFADVSQDMWYYGAVAKASEKGWIGGYPDGTFGPERYITRAEVTVIINRMENREADMEFITENMKDMNIFTDLPSSHWAYSSMMEASNGHKYVRGEGYAKEIWTETNK